VIDKSVGRLTEVRYPLGTTAQVGVYRVLAYDSIGRVTQEQRVIDATSGVHSYVYDDLDRLIAKTFPDSTEQNNTYFPAGGPLRFVRAIASGVTTVIAEFPLYSATGQILKKRSGGVTTDYVYNDKLRLFTLVATGPAGAIQQSYRYTYDPAGTVSSPAWTLIYEKPRLSVGSFSDDETELEKLLLEPDRASAVDLDRLAHLLRRLSDQIAF